MNKGELVDAIAKKAKLSQAASKKAVDAMIGEIKRALSKGDKVQLIGFGSFEVRKRQARTGRNPQTGAVLKIKARKVAAFRPGKALSASVK